MLKVIKNRIEQGYRTSKYPEEEIKLYKRFRGLPSIDPACDTALVQRCAEACPQDAIDQDGCRIDLGKCVFCGLCETLSEGKFIRFSQNFEMGTAQRDDLFTQGSLPELAEHSKKHFKKLFGRSLQLRQISAGGCNACEADTNVLNTPFFDL
ncbi:MAG: hydrogenase, partial [Candidatus Electrothrix sp. AR3]|nr:hydrogenase [Candidatus Electrothrix sp. AR3]